MNNSSTRVVLVDDHPIVGLGVKAMLDRYTDYTLAHHAYCGKDLLEYFETASADLLLLDLNLPDMEYVELIKACRQAVPNMKIVAYTAYNDAQLVRGVLRQKVDGYLLKTTSPSEFRTALYQVLTTKEVYISEAVQFGRAKQPTQTLLKDNFQKRLSLSKREKEILMLISQGYTSIGISETLFISKHTVETHRKNILRKLNFNSSTELVKFAVQQGLV
ncbi:MAG: response regulator transcription factor [Bacteroidota bacterium]